VAATAWSDGASDLTLLGAHPRQRLQRDAQQHLVPHAFKIFLDGFLMNADAYVFGVPRAPLADLYTEPTIANLRNAAAAFIFASTSIGLRSMTAR